MSQSAEPHPATLDEARLLKQCEIRRERRSGPGGQHRNKVETAVVVTHLPSGTRGEAAERRSQEQNRRVAVFRLRVKLAIILRREIDLGDHQPSELWLSRCRTQRIVINPAHEDFPAILSEALDVLASADWNPQTAAAHLQCSASQLIKLLQADPRALVELNGQRAARGLHPLR